MVLHAGLKITGLWSFLSSINAITGFGSFGFANALLFYIPKYQLENDDKKVSSLINTSFFSVLFFTTTLCALSFVIFGLIIPHTVETEFINQAYRLLLFVILSFFFSGLSATYLSILDGLMLMHIRAKINMAGSFVFLITGYILLLKIGIAGIAIAQLVQNIFLLITSFLFVQRHIPSYRFSISFNRPVFKNIFRYGFNFQVISITQIISDPFMKSMITRYAGMHNTAIFDFCIKLLSVFRSLLISANQSIVPQITVYKAIGNQKRIQIFYKANFKLVLFASVILFLSPVAMSDSISLFFLGHTSNDFNFILLNVSLGLLINAIAIPAHFYYLGTGNLKWNVINNIVTAALILIFTPLIGEMIGGVYVVVCWSIAAIIGSSILITAINKENSFSRLPLFGTNTVVLFFLIVFAVILNHYINQLPVIKQSHSALIIINLLILIGCLSYPIFKDTTVKKILKTLRRNYLKKQRLF